MTTYNPDESELQQNQYQRVVFNPEAHEELKKGASILADAVRSTIGPSGHSVIIDNGEHKSPSITKDGVTVANSIYLPEKLQSMGAELLKEVASKTNDIAGDGTSGSVILAHNILQEGVKQINTGRSAIHLKKGLDIGSEKIANFLQEHCIPISGKEDITNVGTISANGDKEVGELIAEAIEKVGQDGIVTVEPAKSIQTSLNFVEGMQLSCGYVSPFFVTNNEKATAELENPYILSTSNQITSLDELLPVLDKISKKNKPLLIIADEIEGDALHTLIVNKMKNVLKCCAIKAPSYDEHRANILDDLKQVIGGEVIGVSSDKSLKKLDVEDLGQAKKAIISRNACTIVGDTNDEQKKQNIQQRVYELRNVLEEDSTLDDLRVNRYRERLAKLSGGIAVIKVGGSTEVEISEKRYRVEDAVNATMAASQEGIVPGGGTALFYASQFLRTLINNEDFKHLNEDTIEGINVIAKVCEDPLRSIVRNTGHADDVVVENLKNEFQSNIKPFLKWKHKMEDERGVMLEWSPPKDASLNVAGYNAYTNQYENLIDVGILDPVLVSKSAISHAVSVIGLTLCCNSVIANEQNK